MTRFLIRRLALTIPVLVGVATLVFSLIHLVPGDPVDVMLGEYAVAFDTPTSLWANWGVWRSHRSEIGMTSGMGAVVDVRPAHDICLSNYYLSVTLVGPMDMTPW